MQSSSQTAVLSLPRLRSYQEPVLLSTNRDDLTVSAPQLGKTETARIWLAAAAWNAPPLYPWWWMAPTYAQCKHGFLGLCRHLIDAGALEPRNATTTPPLLAKLKNGATIEGRSWDQPQSVYGPSIMGGVIDEFGWLTGPAYSAISSRRAETVIQGYGFFRYLGNVGEIGTIAEDLWDRAEAGTAGFSGRRWTWRDRAIDLPCPCGIESIDLGLWEQHGDACPRGRYLTHLFNESARMSGPQFRQLFEAEWTDWSELPAYTFDRGLHVDVGAEFVDGLPLHVNCDFNVDPMAWTLGHTRGDRSWTFDEIVIAGGATTPDACAELISRHPDPRLTVEVFGDASGRARDTRSHTSDYDQINEILGSHYRDVTVRVPLRNPAVRTRLNTVNARLRNTQGEVKHTMHPRCKTLTKDRARAKLLSGTSDLDKRNKHLTHASDADDYRLCELFPLEGPAVRVASSGILDEHFREHDSVLGMEN